MSLDNNGINNHSNQHHLNNKNLTGRPNIKLKLSQVNYVTKQFQNESVHILKDNCGEFHAGRLTAILGPSGAGKTSMLNVLSAFKATGMTGHITVNNELRNIYSFRKMASYIPQDFAMLDLLTVEETLQVSTELKLPTEISKCEKNKIVTEILQIINMEKCRNTLVKNISGGEKKRLSIGIELVTNPPIMFFDEPTSGLDSVASFQLISHLKSLAQDGRIIVCVIHQPSSRLMKLFDDILVLSRGEVLYCGPQEEMLPQFEQIGYSCPKYYNPADYVLEVASEERNARNAELILQNKSKYGEDITISTPVHTLQISDEKSKMLPNVENINSDLNKKRSSLHHCRAVRPKSQVNGWHQFYILTIRSLRSMSRNMLCVQLRIVTHIIVATLLGSVFWNIGNDGAKVLTNASCQFFVVLFLFFGNAMPSILLCPQETNVFIREYLNGWYSLSSYYIAKIIADLPMQFICPTLFISILYPMSGQTPDVGRFVMCWGICLLTTIIGHFIGLVLGSSFEIQMAIFLVPATQIPFLIFSGFFIRLHEVPDILKFFSDVSFFRYTLEGLIQALYAYDRPDLECNIEFCYLRCPKKFLREMDMFEERYGIDILAIIIWILFFMLLFFLSLIWRIKRSI